jgi:hypothetical protein
MRSAAVAREPLNFDRYKVEMSDRNFQRLHRLSKADFMKLSLLLRPHLERQQSHPRGCNPAVKTTVMLAITMRILAGASYLDVGWLSGLADATVYAFFDETLAAIGELLDSMSFPKSAAECGKRWTIDFPREAQAITSLPSALMTGMSPFHQTRSMSPSPGVGDFCARA